MVPLFLSSTKIAEKSFKTGDYKEKNTRLIVFILSVKGLFNTQKINILYLIKGLNKKHKIILIDY